MEYISIKEIAERWDMSVRYVQQYCVDGRIPGATKIGRAWAIPADAQKPGDFRNPKTKERAKREQDYSVPLPLTSMAFLPGQAKVCAISQNQPIALAEYSFFTGNPAEAVSLTEPLLMDRDLGIRLSACLIYAFSSLALQKLNNTYRAKEIIERTLDSLDPDVPEEQKALAIFACSSVYTFLNLPRPDKIPELQFYVRKLPGALRSVSAYVQARLAYLNRLYGTAIGIVETALVLEEKEYPIPTIYLHLTCAMSYMHTPYIPLAKRHLLEAWAIAKEDNLIGPFAELHPFLGGLIEAVLKKEDPEGFRRIVSYTNDYFKGWRMVHNRLSGHQIPIDLTTTEFTVAVLASRNWTNGQIAEYLGISENTVKRHIVNLMNKVHFEHRKELAKYIIY